MGNPILDDSLDRNRWDYVYSIQLPNSSYIKSKLQVYFVDERLSYFEGDYAPTEVHEERAKQATAERAELSAQTDATAVAMEQTKEEKEKETMKAVSEEAEQAEQTETTKE